MEKRLLIVDDDKAILHAYKRLFRFAGIEVDIAKNMEKAQCFMKKNVYRAMVTDLCLNPEDGTEGLQLLQAMKNINRNTKLILITGYGDIKTRKKAEQLGIDYYFEKPVPVNNLIKILQTLTD